MNALTIAIIILLILLATAVISMQVKDYYSQEDPVIQSLLEDARKVSPEAAAKIRIYKGDKSYTINKRNVYLCLHDENGEYYNREILRYVLYHELSHVLCKSVGHTAEFDEIFKDMIRKAEDMGLYDSSVKIPKNYCEY